MTNDKTFHGIYTTGGGLGTKMGIYVKESDYEQARPIAERILQRVGCESFPFPLGGLGY